MSIDKFEILNTIVEATEIYNSVLEIADINTLGASGEANITYQTLTQPTISVNGNTRLGHNSLLSDPSGDITSNNTGVGVYALSSISDGANDNVGIGHQVGANIVSGSGNVCIGSFSLYDNLVGSDNTAVGCFSLRSESNESNTAIGHNALSADVSGYGNTCIGCESLAQPGFYFVTTPDQTSKNTTIGYRTLYSNIESKDNVAIGSGALQYSTIANRNVCIGYESMRSDPTYSFEENVSIGNQAMFNNDENYNVCVGNNAMYNPIRCSYTTCVGHSALFSDLDSCGCVAIGTNALKSQVGRHDNIAIGTYAMENSTAYGPNISIGTDAYKNGGLETGDYNIAIGPEALKFNKIGQTNIAIGSNSISTSLSGSGNVCVGYNTLSKLQTGNYNCAFGANALSNLLNGSYNSAMGSNAMSTLINGSNNTCVGYDSQPSSSNVSNEFTLGYYKTTSLQCAVPLTILSDKRDKTDIEDMDLGMDFVEKLNPVKFKWDKREWYEKARIPKNGSKRDTKLNTGYIAQDLDGIERANNWDYLNLVYKSNPNKLEVTYMNTIFPMINAIKELNDLAKSLRTKIDSYKASKNI